MVTEGGRQENSITEPDTQIWLSHVPLVGNIQTGQKFDNILRISCVFI